MTGAPAAASAVPGVSPMAAEAAAAGPLVPVGVDAGPSVGQEVPALALVQSPYQNMDSNMLELTLAARDREVQYLKRKLNISKQNHRRVVS